MNQVFPISWFIFTIMVIYLVNKYKKCQYRVPLTYLIIALTIYSIIIIQYLIPPSYTTLIIQHYWGFSIGVIVVLFALFLVPINSYSQTLLFVLFTILLAMVINPLFTISRHNNVVIPCLITVLGIFSIFSLISYTHPNLVSFRWFNALFFSLIGLLILRISYFWFTPSNNLLKISSYFGIVLFIVFILYDTKLMLYRANNCQRPYSYLRNVISLVLDFVNLLTDTMSVSNINK